MKRMVAKFDGRCRDCGGALDAGDMIRWSRATGALHADAQDCREIADMRAEQAAEMRMESWAEHRMAGISHLFWENQ